MDRIVVERQVSVEGVLNLILPLGKDQAGQNVRVTVEPVDLKKKRTVEQWRAGILATAGGWEGEFERPTPGLMLEDWQ